jgi:hypothetical protein
VPSAYIDSHGGLIVVLDVDRRMEIRQRRPQAQGPPPRCPETPRRPLLATGAPVSAEAGNGDPWRRTGSKNNQELNPAQHPRRRESALNRFPGRSS